MSSRAMSKRKFLTPAVIQESITLIREQGLKAFIKQKGWVIVVAIFLFYLIRDSILYIIIPYFVARGLLCS